MRALAFLAATLALAGCGGSSWSTWQERGVSVRVPPGWHATSARLTPVTWPVQFIAVGSYALPHDASGADGCEPKEAVDRLPANGVLIFGWEYTGAGIGGRSIRLADFAPRPVHFRLVHLGRYECLGHSYLIRFRTSGRYFQVHVLLGRRATTRTRMLALRVLDSLAIRRR